MYTINPVLIGNYSLDKPQSCNLPTPLFTVLKFSKEMSDHAIDKHFLIRQVVTLGFSLVAMYLAKKILNGMMEDMGGRKKVKTLVYEVWNHKH